MFLPSIGIFLYNSIEKAGTSVINMARETVSIVSHGTIGHVHQTSAEEKAGQEKDIQEKGIQEEKLEPSSKDKEIKEEIKEAKFEKPTTPQFPGDQGSNPKNKPSPANSSQPVSSTSSTSEFPYALKNHGGNKKEIEKQKIINRCAAALALTSVASGSAYGFAIATPLLTAYSAHGLGAAVLTFVASTNPLFIAMAATAGSALLLATIGAAMGYKKHPDATEKFKKPDSPLRRVRSDSVGSETSIKTVVDDNRKIVAAA